MKNRLIFFALAFLLPFVRSTFAGMEGLMSDREWFERSNKILVLEYENPLGGRAGAQLAQLIGRMALATTTGVDKFAVVTLQQEEEHIPLTERNVEALAVRQRAPVVVWGEFYEQNERIFVTSHLRYALMDTDPNVRPDPTERSPVKQADLNRQGDAFVSQHLGPSVRRANHTIGDIKPEFSYLCRIFVPLRVQGQRFAPSTF